MQVSPQATIDANNKCTSNLSISSSTTKSIVKSKKTSKSTVVVADEAIKEVVERLDVDKLYDIPMIPVNASFGVVNEKPEASIALSPMTKKERGYVRSDVTVVFAVRRPGCGACREHGLQLTKLATEEKACVVGAIKEIDVDNEALIEFYDEYFHFPIYKDAKWDIFKAMGGRRIPLWKLLSTFPKMNKRYKQNNIKNVPFGGDIWTQGGVLIFDRKGRVRHVYYENYGEELNLDELRQAIQAIRRTY